MIDQEPRPDAPRDPEELPLAPHAENSASPEDQPAASEISTEATGRFETGERSEAEERFDTGERALDPRWVANQRLRASIFLTLVLGVTFPLVVGFVLGSSGWRFAVVLLWLAAACFLAARAWWWPAVRYRHISYRLDADKLVIRRGVFWRSEALVPRTRVQHTDVTQGPIQRQFGLGTLTVHTAGTQFAAVPLGGLAYETALALRDQLTDHETADGV
ncbi:MAG: PH domain-containing protein [Acidobacteriota bacterium]